MKRHQSLDILRGVAILLVLGRHMNYYRFWYNPGWTGVPLFFVLSGFLISGLLFQEYQERGSIDFPRFFCRRAFKIWPSYYALLAFTAYLYHRGRLPIPAHSITLAVTFLSNYFVGTRHEWYPLDHTWSLCVEEHFYLALPVVLVVLMRFGRSKEDPFRIIPYLFGFSLALCLLLRVFIVMKDGWTPRTDMVFDSLLAGVFLGYLYHFRPNWFAKVSEPRWLLLSAALFAPMVFVEGLSRMVETIGLTALTISFFFLVAWSARREHVIPGFAGKLLARIGFYSYSIYLWHMYLTARVFHYPVTFSSYWIYVIGSVSVGILMANLIELPFLAIRDRVIPRRGTTKIPAVEVEQAPALV